MRPTRAQAKALAKYLPKGAKPIDVILRAYCVAKPAVLCAVYVTPQCDYRPHLATRPRDPFYSGVVLHAGVGGVAVGDWATLVYASYNGGSSSGWFWAEAQPLRPFRSEAK